MVSRVIVTFIGIAAFAAAGICYMLTTKHIRGSTGVGWFESVCSDQPGPGNISCAQVLKSPYSYFPPKHPDRPDRLPHFPVSFLGFLYYSTILVWIIGIGRPSYLRRRIHLLPLFFVGIGLVFSGYFLFIMYRVVTEWCPWCVVTHGLNLLIAVGLVALWPRNRETAPPAAEDFDVIKHTTHPSSRLVWVTILAILLVNYGNFFLFAFKDLKKDSEVLKAELGMFRSNVGAFMAQWQLASPCDLPVRPDEPVRSFNADSVEPVLDVVVFSDFECPGCAKFAKFFEANVPPMFAGHVRLRFRHFPLDQSCNRLASKTLHPNACAAAGLTEAVRAQRPDAFWEAHDFLFEHQHEIAQGKMNAQRVAEALGMDVSALQKGLDPATFAARIADDGEQARACQLRATPSIHVDGKRIESAAATNLDFWDTMADWFWLEKAKKERPASTRRPPPATTGA